MTLNRTLAVALAVASTGHHAGFPSPLQVYAPVSTWLKRR